MNLLRMDLHRWIALLSSWERAFSTSLVCRILSAESLARDQHSVYVVQSDGYGYGYFHFYLNATEVHYISKRWRNQVTRRISSFVLFPTFWTRQQSMTASSYGLMIINRQLIPSTRATVRILPVEYCYPRFVGSVIALGNRYWPFGFLGSRTNLPTTYLTSQHILTSRTCTEPWQQSLQRLETKVARKSHSKYMMRVNKQYVHHTNRYGGRAYPPSYGPLC